MIDVRRDVLEETSGKQVPWENSSLTGQFYFKPAAPKTAENGFADTAAEIAALREEIARLQANQNALLTRKRTSWRRCNRSSRPRPAKSRLKFLKHPPQAASSPSSPRHPPRTRQRRRQPTSLRAISLA